MGRVRLLRQASISLVILMAGCRAARDIAGDSAREVGSVAPATLRLEMLYVDQKDYAELEDVWAYVDEMAFGPSKKELLNLNGLRVGLARALTLEEVVGRLRGCIARRNSAVVDFGPGVRSLAPLGEPIAQRYLFLVSSTKLVSVEPVRDVQLKVRIQVSEAKPDSVRVEITPGMYSRDDQHFGVPMVEFAHLSVATVVRPNQVILMGPAEAGRGTLGSVLYTRPEDGSEQQVLMVLYPAFN